MLSTSPVPLYHQIAQELERKIGSEELPAGTLLPSEKALAQQYRVSLITIRGAMRLLAEKGLVSPKRGKGTFVLGDADRAVWGLGWLNDLITSVLPSRLEILSRGFITAPKWIAMRLGVASDEAVYGLRTLRRDTQRQDQPFMTTDIFLPPDIGATLADVDMTAAIAGSKLVIMVVEKECGIRVASVRQSMTAQLARAETSDLLSIQRGEPLLVVTRDYFDTFGRLVQVGRSWYRTDRYDYLVNLSAVSYQVRTRDSAAGDNVGVPARKDTTACAPSIQRCQESKPRSRQKHYLSGPRRRGKLP